MSRGAYRDRGYARPPVHHDHVGHMTYDDDEARCDQGEGACGQVWRLTEQGWRAIT